MSKFTVVPVVNKTYRIPRFTHLQWTLEGTNFDNGLSRDACMPMLPENKAILTKERVGRKRSIEKLDSAMCHQPTSKSGMMDREGGRAHKRVCLEPPQDMKKPLDQETYESKDFSASQSLLSLRNSSPGCGREVRGLEWIKCEADTSQPILAA